jgi:hypothetical protein
MPDITTMYRLGWQASGKKSKSGRGLVSTYLHTTSHCIVTTLLLVCLAVVFGVACAGQCDDKLQLFTHYHTANLLAMFSAVLIVNCMY